MKPFIENAKGTNLFTGYNNDETILSRAINMRRYSDKINAIIYGNDWPQFDAHLTLQLNAVKTVIYNKIIKDNLGQKYS